MRASLILVFMIAVAWGNPVNHDGRGRSPGVWDQGGSIAESSASLLLRPYSVGILS